MNLSWLAKKILSKIGVNFDLNTLALLFWWFSFSDFIPSTLPKVELSHI
jgi:hypothetical protein